ALPISSSSLLRADGATVAHPLPSLAPSERPSRGLVPPSRRRSDRPAASSLRLAGGATVPRPRPSVAPSEPRSRALLPKCRTVSTPSCRRSQGRTSQRNSYALLRGPWCLQEGGGQGQGPAIGTERGAACNRGRGPAPSLP